MDLEQDDDYFVEEAKLSSCNDTDIEKEEENFVKE